MGVTAGNLIMGPGVLYHGDYQATEPDDTAVATAPSGADWTDIGGTMDGVTLTINQEFKELEVDQIVDVVGRRLTKRDMQIKTNMAEATLENLAIASNGSATISTGTGFKALEPANDTSATQPTYIALLFDGFAPGGGDGAAKQRRFIARRCLSTDNSELAYKKDDQTVITATFSAHYVSSSIAPYKIIDEV